MKCSQTINFLLDDSCYHIDVWYIVAQTGNASEKDTSVSKITENNPALIVGTSVFDITFHYFQPYLFQYSISESCNKSSKKKKSF